MDGRGCQSGPCRGGGWGFGIQIIEAVKVVHDGEALGSYVDGRGIFCREHLITGTSAFSLYCVNAGMTAVGKVYEHLFVSAFSLANFSSSPSNWKTHLCSLGVSSRLYLRDKAKYITNIVSRLRVEWEC